MLGAIDPAEIGSVKLKEQVVCDKIPKVSVDRHRSRQKPSRGHGHVRKNGSKTHTSFYNK